MATTKTTYLDELKHYVCLFAEARIKNFMSLDAETLLGNARDGYLMAGRDILWYLMNFASQHNENINWFSLDSEGIINWLNSPFKKSEDDLLPCPFCGGEAYLSRVGQCLPDYQITCEDCEFSTGTYKSEKEVIDIWNNLKGVKRDNDDEDEGE